MYKNVKSKIILISVLIGLILIGAIGYLYLNSLAQIPQLIDGQDVSILAQAKKSIAIIIGIYIVSAIAISIYLSKFVICPKNKYIKSDERAELRDKLNEVSSRKNQIETILLHMTDGIIAFNMKGEIILINPAAKKFLSISPEDNTFDDIFGKYYRDTSSNDSTTRDPNLWYYYDRTNNTVYFNKYTATSEAQIYYAIKIEKSVLNSKLQNGSFKIENIAYACEKDQSHTGDTTGSLIIKNQTPTDLITKTYQSAALPGYISYTLDINPQGKTLSSGDTIDIEDLFKTVSYYDSDWNGGEMTNGTNLVDVLMRNINIYKIDANGDKQRLSASEYTAVRLQRKWCAE